MKKNFKILSKCIAIACALGISAAAVVPAYAYGNRVLSPNGQQIIDTSKGDLIIARVENNGWVFDGEDVHIGYVFEGKFYEFVDAHFNEAASLTDGRMCVDDEGILYSDTYVGLAQTQYVIYGNNICSRGNKDVVYGTVTRIQTMGDKIYQILEDEKLARRLQQEK